MRKIVPTLFLLTILFLPLDLAYAGEEDMYIISFADDINERTILSSGATIVDVLNNSPIAIIHADKQAISTLQNAENIVSIEKNKKVHIAAEKVSWGFETTKVRTPWKTGYTGKGVKIAVIDTGVGPHEDLNVKRSVSFIESERSTADLNGHGTHIAGIISALHNNFGVKGIAPDAEINGLKVFDKDGTGFTHDVMRAIDWAIDKKMDIINLSLTSEVPLNSYETVINRAYEEGILIVGAAGNSTTTNPKVDNVQYPARFDNVIAVSSVDWDGNKGYYSSIGPSVEVAAPGVSIYSTHLDNSYTYLQGTSMSTAFVTGHLALLKEAYPHLTNVQLRKKLIDDVIDLGPRGRDTVFGYGLIQATSYRLPLYEYPAMKNPVLTLITSHEGVAGKENSTIKVEVKALLKDGKMEDVTKFTKWTVANPTIASSRGGRIDLHKEGETTLNITYGGKSVQLPIEVNASFPPTNPDQFTFIDLPAKHWANDAIQEMHKKHIITGYEDHTFKPSSPIERQHVAAIIARTTDLEPNVPLRPFLDVKMSSPYYYEIMKTQQANVFTGFENKFQPKGFLTRAQMAKIIVETFNLPKTGTPHPFPDVNKTHWANKYIDTLYETGITTGSSGLYNPDEPVTRTQFAVFIHRTLNHIDAQN